MGYSCTAKASLVLTALDTLIAGKVSNALPGDAGFYERGRENRDGAVTGAVFKTVKRYTAEERAAKAAEMSKGGVEVRPDWVGDPCTRAGSFRIEPDGKIKRFPLVSKELREKAEAAGLAEYSRIYERGGTNV